MGRISERAERFARKVYRKPKQAPAPARPGDAEDFRTRLLRRRERALRTRRGL